jgi:hypothetical protein
MPDEGVMRGSRCDRGRGGAAGIVEPEMRDCVAHDLAQHRPILRDRGRHQLSRQSRLPRVEVLMQEDVADPQMTEIAGSSTQDPRVLGVRARGDVDLPGQPAFDPVAQQRCRRTRARGGGSKIDCGVHLSAGHQRAVRLDVLLGGDGLDLRRSAERAASLRDPAARQRTQNESPTTCMDAMSRP